MTHYRKELKFSFDSLIAAENAYNKLKKRNLFLFLKMVKKEYL